MINGIRTGRGVIFSLSAVVVMLVAGPALSAGAETATPSPVPSWSTTATAPLYTETMPPAPTTETWIDEQKPTEKLRVSYQSPTGRGPGYGQPDLDIVAETADPESVQVSLDRSSFVPTITSIVDVFSPDVDGEPQLVTATFDRANTFTIHRPDVSLLCVLGDAWNYRHVQIAALGQDQHKYLIQVEVSFGSRKWDSAKACATQAVKNKAGVAVESTAQPSTSTPAPTQTAGPVKSKVDAEKAKAKKKLDAVKKKADAKLEDLKPVNHMSGPVVIIGIILVALLVLGAIAYLVLKPKAASRDHDGKPKDRSAQRTNERKWGQ